MAVLAEWDRILSNWALWLLGGRGGSGFASPVYSMAPRGRRSDDWMSLLLAEAVDPDSKIRQLPKVQQNALVAWYVWSGAVAVRARQLGCCENTLRNRVLQAKQRLAELKYAPPIELRVPLGI